MKASDGPIIVEQVFDVAPNIVWRAITEIDLMRQWYFQNIPDFSAQVGFETKFDVQSDERVFPHCWRVTEVVPQKKLVYDWSYDNYPGDAYVVWELLDEGKSTRLRLTVRVREDFPDDIPEFTRESCIGGWDYFIKDRLKAFLKTK